MARYASGKKSKAISDISGFKVRYTSLKTTYDNLRVEPEEFDPKHPQLTPAKNVFDATALFQPRPDNAEENVKLFLEFNPDIFASKIEKSQKGIGVKGLAQVEPLTSASFNFGADSGECVGTSAIGTTLINLELDSLFNEYKNKNLALIFIEENTSSNKNVYIKSYIQGKNISKSLKFKKENLNTDKFYVKVITESKEELINLIKSQNLINIRTPSFLNANLNLSRKSNLVELNSRIKKIDVIENIYVQNFNKNYVNLRIKYLGKLEKIINLLKTENIDLQLINDQWIIKVL